MDNNKTMKAVSYTHLDVYKRQDYGDGTNYQYNYSHGHTASTIMFCGGQSINNTFRYNISQNEDMGPLDPAGNSGNTQVYNNTSVSYTHLDVYKRQYYRRKGA